jgi:hypothetical protein
MSSHRGRIHEQITGLGKGFGLQILPQPLPDSALFPAPKAHVDRMPVAECFRQIPPGTARAIQIQERFEEFPIAEARRGARGGIFGRGHRRLQLFPQHIVNQFSLLEFAHPKFPACFRESVQIIREHYLVAAAALPLVPLGPKRRSPDDER